MKKKKIEEILGGILLIITDTEDLFGSGAWDTVTNEELDTFLRERHERIREWLEPLLKKE